jgi:hypothetical protein
LQEAIDGYRQCSLDLDQNPEEIRKRAMQDPEVQAILNDPAMRMILGNDQSVCHATLNVSSFFFLN